MLLSEAKGTGPDRLGLAWGAKGPGQDRLGLAWGAKGPGPDRLGFGLGGKGVISCTSNITFQWILQKEC